MSSSTEVDVLIVGAGPVGLILAYQLAKFGGVTVKIIERHVKSMQDAYGRAITLYPRTSELLDQLGLAEELAQQCFACRDTVAYNSKGEEVYGRGWDFMRDMKDDTNWGFALVLRQKYQEEVFRNAMKRHGVEVEAPVELTAMVTDENLPITQHRVTATMKNGHSGEISTIKCRYLVGSDGGRSTVRKLMEIPFNGSTSEDKWVRIDGPLKTNLPKPRTYCAIESPTHGNILWAALDRGATRIGYAFTADRAAAYETFDEAAAMKEAIAAVKPFDIEFERVDWWTIYAVGQRIAQDFFVKNCVFLAGDACHTHSSGAAQGENTGIHDAVNLGWKLSLVLRGLAPPDLLLSYQAERLPNVERLIKYDRDISRLMTNRLPEDWTGDEKADVSVVLGKLMKEAGTFSSGLGIFYDLRSDNPVSVMGSLICGEDISAVRPGRRAPDVRILRPGTFQFTSLIKETPNTTSFYLMIFTGRPSSTNEATVSQALASSAQLQRMTEKGCLSFITIVGVHAASAYEVLGHEPLGRNYFDPDQSAHARYGVQADQGAIAVLRPDGWLGTMTSLDVTAVGELERYFARILSV